MNTFNIANPTIGATASTTANKYFSIVLYFGNGGTQTVSGVGFEPGLVWNKSRGSGNNNCLNDVLRGAGNTLFSDDPSSNANLTSYFTAFTSDGYSFALGGGAFNAPYNYVAWNWRANGAGVTNTNGSIISTVSANTTSGFSIVTFTGNSTAGATIGHGLGVAPTMAFVKSRSDAYNWCVYAKAANSGNGQNGGFYLNRTDAWFSDSGFWNNTTASSTVLTLGSGFAVNNSGSTYVAYCFAPVAGYSAFGSYTGNGSSDGPFIFTGFRPRYIMIKRTDAAQSWWITDTARNPYNTCNLDLFANLSNAEENNGYNLDLTSNGVKIRTSTNDRNASGGTYIYMAFAENPFKYANAR
jgi:hypothetical protein